MDWQQIIVYLIVAAAALYLARGYLGRGKKGGCGGCANSGCGTGENRSEKNGKASPELVQIAPAPQKRGEGPERLP